MLSAVHAESIPGIAPVRPLMPDGRAHERLQFAHHQCERSRAFPINGRTRPGTHSRAAP